MHPLLTDLNPDQRRAVCHDTGPLLVLAGPGSGKTRVITTRIAYRVEIGQLQPERILAITFTNAAAGEMRGRVRSLLGADVPSRIGTFHWMCHGLLRRYIGYIGRRQDFRLLSPPEARQVLRRVLARSGPDANLGRDTGLALRAFRNGTAAEIVAAEHRIPPRRLHDLAKEYDSELRTLNAVDLDGLQSLALQVLESDVTLKERCSRAHDEILIDEYQDVNPVQRRLVALLCPPSRSVVAVGDDDQAIYAWRQADAEAIYRFSDDFPGAATVVLRDTYRSTKLILRAAGSVVRHNVRSQSKELRTRRLAGETPICLVAADEIEEADWIASEIARRAKRDRASWTDFAVLYRVNAQARALEDAFVRSGIPYRVRGSTRFYELPEIRRAIAYLRLALDAADDEAMRYLLEGIPGIGARRTQAIEAHAATRKASLLESLNEPCGIPGVPDAVAHLVHGLANRVQAVRTHRTEAMERLVGYAIDSSLADIDPIATDFEAASENLGELRSLERESRAGRATLRTFLEHLSLGSDAAQNAEAVSLMTLHAAKGTEFPVVFICGLEEGLLPHRRSFDNPEGVDEERRLCYVGMTRAMNVLYLTYAHMRLLGGNAMLSGPSRFVAETGLANTAFRVARRAAAKPRLTSVREGDRIHHPRWSGGTVEAVEGTGCDTIVTIVFDQAGRKRLQLCHAPLKREYIEARNVVGA